jgi:FkbM family methyltransferase
MTVPNTDGDNGKVDHECNGKGNKMKTRRDLREDFEHGVLNKKEYWAALRKQNSVLQDYQALIADTAVAAIEILQDELRIVTDENVKMVWDPNDIGTAPSVMVANGHYETVESHALFKAAEGAQTIFDIGANVGYYSLHWVSRLAPEGKIHAFEPVPATYSWLLRNIAANHFERRICANNFALGSEITGGKIFFPLESGAGAASTKSLHPEEKTIDIDILISTIDRYFQAANLKRFDLLKADVEGAELFVIKGGIKTIAALKPLIFLELLRKWSKPFGYHPNDVIALLGQLGYRCFTFEGDHLIPFTEMTEETMQTNFFFAHPVCHQQWLADNHLS